jgi:hypothetical protein
VPNNNSNNEHNNNRRSPLKASPASSPTNKSNLANKLRADLQKSQENDLRRSQSNDGLNLPVFALQPLDEALLHTSNSFESHERRTPNSTNSRGKSRKDTLRTDKNHKAKYMNTPQGKFRREFSLDHPLAPGGTGQYKRERSLGKLPTGLGLEIERLDLTNEDNINLKAKTHAFDSKNAEELTRSADKIERLTYTAQNKVVDPQNALQELKAQQNLTLKQVLEEERVHEEKRRVTSDQVHDADERHNLEQVFAIERKKASERIVTLTKQHEEAMKTAILNSMNLGLH